VLAFIAIFGLAALNFIWRSCAFTLLHFMQFSGHITLIIFGHDTQCCTHSCCIFLCCTAACCPQNATNSNYKFIHDVAFCRQLLFVTDDSKCYLISSVLWHVFLHNSLALAATVCKTPWGCCIIRSTWYYPADLYCILVCCQDLLPVSIVLALM